LREEFAKTLTEKCAPGGEHVASHLNSSERS
jgi:hypothetical protein